MKYYIIIDNTAKQCPYIGVFVQPETNKLYPVPQLAIRGAKMWEVATEPNDNPYDEFDAMMNFYREHKLKGQTWEIRELTFLVGPPLTLPW